MAVLVEQNSFVRQIVRYQQGIAVLARYHGQAGRESDILHVGSLKSLPWRRGARRHLHESAAGNFSVFEVVDEYSIPHVALLLAQRIRERPDRGIDMPAIA